MSKLRDRHDVQPSTTSKHRWMQRLLQIDAAGGLVKWLRSIGVEVEPYDRRLHDWEDR